MSAAIALLLAADEVPSIIVTGRGLREVSGDAAYGTISIDGDRLRNNASGRIESVLADAAGFQMFRRADSRAANPTSQGATLRALGGNASSRALVLLDGVPQADPFAGFIPYAALRPERLASVRVTRGGGAGAFGGGAVAGTIELESGSPDTLPALGLRAAYGSRNASELSGGITQKLGSGFVSANAGWDRGDGYLLISPAQRGAADIPAHYDAWSAAIRAVAPLSATNEVQFGALLFDDHRLRGVAGTDARSRGADASIRFVGRGRWGVQALAYVQERGFTSGFVSVAADRNSATPTLDQYATPALGLGGLIEVRPPVGQNQALRLGVDVRRASGNTNERFRYIAGSGFTRTRRAGGETLNYGAFIEDSWSLGTVTLTGGARIDHWAITGGFLDESVIGTGVLTQSARYADRSGNEPSFRGGSVWRVTPALSLRAAGYAGFRVPTLNELYRPFRVGADATASNPALDIEKLSGFEGGVDWKPLPHVTLMMTGFADKLRGAITNVTLDNGPGTFPQVGVVAAGGVFRQRLNVDAIRVAGIEASASARLGDWRLNAAWSWTDPRVRASGLAAALNGLRPAQSPQHQGSATIGWEPARGPTFSATLRYQGRQFEDDQNSRVIRSALTLDGAASVHLSPTTRLSARVENLFDAGVVSGISFTGIEDLGTPRTLWLGIVFER